MKAVVSKRQSWPVLAAGLLSLAYILALVFVPSPGPPARGQMVAASRLMARAEAVIAKCRTERGIPPDPTADPNGTGLVGVEMSEITTTLGNLEAKRTTTNPNFAGLAVDLFREAGVERGDAVAVGASGSFPALITAVLAASRVMDLRPLLIVSLGSSQWGANVPGFTWMDMAGCLRRAGVLAVRPIAAAIGGDEDVGRDMSAEGRALLARRIEADGLPVVGRPELEADVAARLGLYEAAARGRPIRAFVNIGGSWANMGTNAEVLRLRPGLTRDVFVPPPGERGVIQAMAARGIPVIHFLNIRGLAERYRLPWDPKPLTEPGEGAFYRQAAARRPAFIFVTAGYVLIIVVLLVLAGRRPRLGT